MTFDEDPTSDKYALDLACAEVRKLQAEVNRLDMEVTRWKWKFGNLSDEVRRLLDIEQRLDKAWGATNEKSKGNE